MIEQNFYFNTQLKRKVAVIFMNKGFYLMPHTATVQRACFYSLYDESPTSFAIHILCNYSNNSKHVQTEHTVVVGQSYTSTQREY